MLNCGYFPFDPPECDIGSQLVSFTNATELIECISGYTDLGLNGVFDGGPGGVITWTAITAGGAANVIAITGVTPTIEMPGSGYLDGGSDSAPYVGAVAPVGTPYTGFFPITITGSGLYSGFITGLVQTTYTKTFSGSWAMYTGTAASSLVPIPLLGDGYHATGIFPPNTYINWQVGYSGVSGDAAALVITGADVINGISQTLSFL